jgi:hypothetical protein
MSEILKHELMPVPIAIAETNGSLRSGNKSLLLDILLKNVDTNGLIYFNDRAALIIDGQFFFQSLKHQGLRTFGEYVDMYVGVVLRKGFIFRRIDVVFDRYRIQSIKSGTRKKRSKSVQPIRRIIENSNVPLPSNLPKFSFFA